jgi:23S rRNA (uracil1939-C5)-methyltransferase
VSSRLPTVSIRSIGAGGDGIATLEDGRTVFVPRSAPGDVVTLTGLRLHKRFARARIAEILTPSPDRVEAPCPHFVRDRCGGCQLMHLSSGAQLSVKRRIVGDALRRIGRLDAEDPAVEPAPSPLGYRSKVTLTVKEGTLGFHRLHEAGEIFEVEHCLLMAPELVETHCRIRAHRSLLPKDTERVVLRLDAAGDRHVIVRTAGGEGWSGAGALHRALEPGTVVWWHPAGGAARAMAGHPSPWPATVFEQVHPAVGRRVREVAVARLLAGAVPNELVWDLYAGIGETTAILLEAPCRVESVELDVRAVRLADERGPAGATRLAGDVADRLPQLSPPALIVTNPPRVGMAEVVSAALARSGARRIVYVSCDAATLARDILRLGDRYRVASVEAFDQFPQTAHVECVATLDLAAGTAAVLAGPSGPR